MIPLPNSTIITKKLYQLIVTPNVHTVLLLVRINQNWPPLDTWALNRLLANFQTHIKIAPQHYNNSEKRETKPIFNKQFNYDNAVKATNDYDKLMYFVDVLAMTDIYDRIRTIASYYRPLIYLNRDSIVDIEKDLSKIII